MRWLIAALALSSGGCDFAFRLDHVDDVTNAGADASSTAFAFVQSNYLTQSNGAPVDLEFPGAQTPGNLNVVVIGWVAAGAVTVTDDNGNAYMVAQGAMTQTNVGQTMYYAENIAGGTNRVHVTFTAMQASSPDVRILEYAGPVHTGAYVGGNSTFGTGVDMTSGPLPIAVPHALLVAGVTVAGVTQSAGPDYSERVKTPFGHLVEDREVLEAASYTASATQDQNVTYVIQLVAFALQ
jgi:hypothetical protein